MKTYRNIVFSLGLLLAAISCAPQTPATEAVVEPAAPVAETGSIQPAFVRDEVIQYVQTNHADTIAAYLNNPTWAPRPEPETHTLAVFGFESDNWQISISVLPAGLFEVDGVTINEDTYNVELTYINAPPFIRWVGNYTQSSGVEEESFAFQASRTEKISAEKARDIALNLLHTAHPEIAQFLSQNDWELLGTQETADQSVDAYKMGDYTLSVNWTEYAGAFSVYGIYEQVGDQYIQIEWNIRVSADGSEASIENYQYFGGE